MAWWLSVIYLANLISALALDPRQTEPCTACWTFTSTVTPDCLICSQTPTDNPALSISPTPTTQSIPPITDACATPTVYTTLGCDYLDGQDNYGVPGNPCLWPAYNVFSTYCFQYEASFTETIHDYGGGCPTEYLTTSDCTATVTTTIPPPASCGGCSTTGTYTPVQYDNEACIDPCSYTSTITKTGW